MTDRVIQDALTIFRNELRLGRPPNIAVLGPPGSGKSDFLHRLQVGIKAESTVGLSINSLHIDLRDAPCDSTETLLEYLSYAALREGSKAGVLQTSAMAMQPPHLRFEAVLSNTLSNVKGILIVFIDHLDSIPRLSASELTLLFRSLLESADQNPNYERLGFVIAGAMSLSQLMSELDSELSFRVLLFPDLDPAVQRELVKDHLEPFVSENISEETLDYLARQTGGEPGFIRPLVSALLKEDGEKLCLDRDSIQQAIEKKFYRSSEDVLRHVALHVWEENSLYEIARRLNDGIVVPPRDVTADIDRFQISGAVVVRTREDKLLVESYDFRNGIVAEFLSQFLKWSDERASLSPNRMLIFDELEKLEVIKSDCLSAKQIWNCIKHLRAVWVLVTSYELPNLHLYTAKRDANSGWWFDGGNRTIQEPERQEQLHEVIKSAAHIAAQNTRTSIVADEQLVCVAVPLVSRSICTVIIASLARSQQTQSFSEFSLKHWILFVQNMKKPLMSLALAEIGQRVVTESPELKRQLGTVREIKDAVKSGEEVLPVVIHLSDLHFGFKTQKENSTKQPMHRFGVGVYNRPLAEHLIDEIKRLDDRHSNQSVVLVISGDIAYEATSEEYDEAQTFIEKVRGEVGLPLERLVIVPGNHDVNWSLSKYKKSQRFDEYLTFLQRVYGEEIIYRLYPYIKWNFKVSAARPSPADILSIHEIPELNLVLVGFNSCVFETEEQHYGLIGEEQLKRAKERLAAIDSKVLRVAVMHHHVIPIENRLRSRNNEVSIDISIVRDFGLVEDHLHRLGFDVVLHGHKHMPALRETTLLSSNASPDYLKRIVICGAGSTGVCYDELPPQTGNHFEVLRFQSRVRIPTEPFITVEWYELAYNDLAEWEKVRCWTILG